MSYSNNYLEKVIYEIMPEGSYCVIRNCSKCGCKRSYVNTNHFRVNANGNLLDVWLIYQCEKCKQTYNVTIYERKKPSDMKKEEYRKFLANDIDLAIAYGNKKELFLKNKADIDLEQISYHVTMKEDINLHSGYNEKTLIIRNPYEIKVRTDKILAEILQVSRSRIKAMIQEDEISAIPPYVGRETEIFYKAGIVYLDK